MNIVYGGAFNPPTKAHKEIINKLFEEFKPNKVILLPVSNKFKKNGLIDDLHRFNMLSLLDERVIVSNIELHKSFNGTYYSLKELSKTYDDICYVIGADNLEKLDEWINFENLINEFRFIIMGRNYIDVPKIINQKYKKHEKRFIYIDIELNICSTNFRKTRDKDLLTKEVYEYIVKNHLYEG